MLFRNRSAPTPLPTTTPLLWRSWAIREWFSRLAHSVLWWLGTIGSVVAVIDGFKLYEGWNPRLVLGITSVNWKFWAALFLVGGSFEVFRDVRKERNSLADVLDTRHRSFTFKEALGEVMRTGSILHANVQVTVKEAEEWVTIGHNLIVDALGDGEGQLFLSNAGYTFYAGNDSEQRLWIEGRLRRLTELQARGNAVNIRPEFKL